MKYFPTLKVLFIACLASSLLCCNEIVDDPNNNNNTPEPTGNLQIFVRKDIASGTYIGGAQVFLYKSEVARDANDVYKTTNTPSVDITTNGALFNELVFQKYYLKATFNNSGKNYEGKGDSYCPVNKTTSYHIVCTEK
ncbi:MAG: hypothetical protein HOD63_04735 [Bacteroidetes bacterium]|jgi:hypothetical protein|nr:hypothetical protein [Bacteroidota bacterium]MBT5529729.1 hypothetical protein [Cytophagia bacterium]MBT3423092.1 hypothetical protein [Bacteroidota bacterium]MBT3801132.1 hypothetical protein [Bacteroidota bacterium]MBT3934906.1 hypothetical protein [Bacteroidota bacterium]